jgi:hypothetical protein
MHLQDSIAYFYIIHSKFGRMKHLFMGIPTMGIPTMGIFLGKKIKKGAEISRVGFSIGISLKIKIYPPGN